MGGAFIRRLINIINSQFEPLAGVTRSDRRSAGTYPFAQVAGEDEVPGEGVGEGGVKLQHLEQRLPLNDVKVAVGQRPDVGTRVRQRRFLPEDVAENVAFA